MGLLSGCPASVWKPSLSLTLFLCIINPLKHKEMPRKADFYTIFYRMGFLMETLFKGDKAFEELSYGWSCLRQSEDKFMTKSEFDEDRMRILHLFGINIESYRCGKNEFKYRIKQPKKTENEILKNLTPLAIRCIEMKLAVDNCTDRIYFQSYFEDTLKLEVLKEAIARNLLIKIKYRAHADNPVVTDVELAPWWIRPHHNHLYLFAPIRKPSGQFTRIIYTYGLDRILDIEILNSHFTAPEITADEHFYYAFGIVVDPKAEPKTILLRAHGKEVKYVRTRPIHHTQQLIGDWNDKVPFADFSICIVPSLEFYGHVLSRGELLEVLGPEDVRQTLAKTVNQIAGRYSNLPGSFAGRV